MMCAVTPRWSGPSVPDSAPRILALDTPRRGFGSDDWRDALHQPLLVGREVVDHPVHPGLARGRIGIVHDQRELHRPGRQAGPGERRREVLAVSGVAPRDRFTIRESRGVQGETHEGPPGIGRTRTIDWRLSPSYPGSVASVQAAPTGRPREEVTEEGMRARRSILMKTRFPVILRRREAVPVGNQDVWCEDDCRGGTDPDGEVEEPMRPILFVVPGLGLRVHSYGVMIFCACASALAMAVWRSRREKVASEAVYELATWLFLGGVIGARLFFFLQHPEAFHQVGDLFRTWEGGNVFYGCILGGLTGSVLSWFRRPYPFLGMCDVAAPAVAIGAAVGRFGCFLNGCCHGAVCQLPWAVRFPAGSHAWVRQLNDGLLQPGDAWSLPVHPTQLYNAGVALIVLGLLLAYSRRARHPGELMGVLMILYPLTRW